MLATWRAARLLRLLCAALIAASPACKPAAATRATPAPQANRKPPQAAPRRPAPPPQKTTVTGTERLAWFQEVPDGASADAFRFSMLVDNKRVALPDATCTPVAKGRYVSCAVALPEMSNGDHKLALIVSRTVGSKTVDSAPSAPIVVKKVNPQKPPGD